ncbi:MAG: protein kinase [Elusimicrobia bacterium]|nr:protein kinase [Elusimicrobiota bacterium]
MGIIPPTDPAFKQGQRKLADAFYKNKNYAEAADAAREAIALDPKNPDAYNTLAQSKLALGDAQGAVEDAKRGLELNARSYPLLSTLKLAETRVGAGTSANQAAQNQPPPAAAQQAGDVSLRPRPWTAHENQAPPGMILSEKSARSKALAAEAERNLKLRSLDDAVRSATKALDENPENLNALYIRAAAHMKRNDWTSARRDVENALRLAPENPKLLSMYSRVLSHDKEYGRALQFAEQAISKDPRFAEAHFNKSLALAGLGRREDSLEALKEAARLSPQQYEQVYEAALQLPTSEDLASLLSGEAPAQSPAAPAKSRRTRGRFVAIGLASLAGGFLIALGLLQAIAGGWLHRVRTSITGVSRRSPSLAPSASVMIEAAPGTLVGGVYEIRKKLGLGGMGVVYEALDKSLDRRVAVKKMRDEIRSDPREAARFLQEARMVAQLHHPNIVEIYSIVEDASNVYLVFEFVDGKTVHQLIDDQRRLPFAQALKILQGACAALAYAHGKNIIHRDLKPSNIMISREGAVKVMDFGVARLAKDSIARLSTPNTIVGTPPYMAPEQEQGAVCKESDVYALGVCLYEMATGEMPFTGAGAGMLLSKMNKNYAPASRLASVPPGFDEFISRVLEPDPAKRIRTSEEFLRQAQELLSRSPAA